MAPFKEYKRKFVLCPDQRGCKRVCTGECDRHPDCGRGLNCGYLFMKNCSFYHPPEHFRLIETSQSAAHSATMSGSYHSPPHGGSMPLPHGQLLFNSPSRGHGNGQGHGPHGHVHGQNQGIPHQTVSADHGIGRKQSHSPPTYGSGGGGSFNQERVDRRFHSADHSPKAWHRKKHAFRNRGQWSREDEEELLRFAHKHGICGSWIPGQHYHEITSKFNRRVEDIKSALVRLQNGHIFQAKREIPLRNTMSPFEEGQIPEHGQQRPPVHHRQQPLHQQQQPPHPISNAKQWMDYEDDYLVTFMTGKHVVDNFTFQHVQEMKQHLHRSLHEIKLRLSWLRGQGRFATHAVKSETVPPNNHYHGQRDSNGQPVPVRSVSTHSAHAAPSGQGQGQQPVQQKRTPSPKEVELHSAMMQGSDYSVSVPQPQHVTVPQPQCDVQQLPALISDINVDPRCEPVCDPRLRIPPPPPPRPVRRYKVPKMPTVAAPKVAAPPTVNVQRVTLPPPTLQSANSRKRKFVAISPDTASCDVKSRSNGHELEKRKMVILDLSLSLSDRLQEGSNLLESMNTRVPQQAHIQDMLILSLKKQIAWVRKANREMHDFQHGLRPKVKSEHKRPSTSPKKKVKAIKTERDPTR